LWTNTDAKRKQDPKSGYTRPEPGSFGTGSSTLDAGIADGMSCQYTLVCLGEGHVDIEVTSMSNSGRKITRVPDVDLSRRSPQKIMTVRVSTATS